ncbi:hypothetical protein [Micromonospora sp. NPDC005203]|uniref:hypothetical protein n=1 Tax=Micromonospora sp. NPDC005203 TaxID=3364226 RepID=UPI00367E1098
MSPRWDDPKSAAGSPDDDTRPSDRTEPSEDRDRLERSAEPGDGRETEDPDTGAETLDPAEERAATDEASLRERSQAGAQQAGTAVAALAGAVGISVASVLGWQKTDDRLWDVARTATAAAEPLEGAASDVRKRRNQEVATEEPNPDVDRQEQPPPDREGERPSTVDRPSAEGPPPDATDDD